MDQDIVVQKADRRGDDAPISDNTEINSISSANAAFSGPTNSYITQIRQNGGLHLLQEGRIKSAFESNGSIGLFYLFYHCKTYRKYVIELIQPHSYLNQ